MRHQEGGGDVIVEHGARRYNVGEMVAKMAAYRLYLCTVEGDEHRRLFQVATAVDNNGVLDRTAYLLGLLLEQAEKLETEYREVKGEPEAKLNYQLLFPELIDSFELPEQGGRRANVLGFRNVSDTRQMVPLSNLVRKDRHRVDLKTSAWIMGRLLKLLAFAHGQGITVRDVTPRNVLIEPDRHSVVVFDWGRAQQYPDGVPTLDVREDILGAARTVIDVLGGTVETGFPNDGTDAFAPYAERLTALARNGERDADQAHREFYELVDGLWPRAYHPFTSFPL
jgi:hypothetical protein